MAEATAQSGAPQKRRSRGLSEKGLAFWMVSPSMALIAIVAAYPIIYAIWISGEPMCSISFRAPPGFFEYTEITLL